MLLNNGVHDSVGGQATAAASCDFSALALAAGYSVATSSDSPDGIRAAVGDLTQSDGPHFIEICVQRGTRADLGRPKATPQDAKASFMQHIGIGR